MKRFIFFTALILALSVPASAAHIKGGFFTYKYLGPGTGTNLRFNVTLTVYMICNPSTGQLSNPINFSIFNGGTNQWIQDASVNITNQFNLGKVRDEPCITGDQSGCYYTVVIYDLPSIELPALPDGYTFAYQRCCRINGINNITNSGNVGNTFTIKIPGTNVGQNAHTNSSPGFLVNDTAVVCAGSYFEYSFQAADTDGDSLSYQFCDAFDGASFATPVVTTASNPPYATIPYAAPYTGASPMGSLVNINPTTGLISGICPGLSGEYVICVCVTEWRNGQAIAFTRKELHVRAGDCSPLSAELIPRQTTCDGFTVNFQNDALNVGVPDYIWNFGEPSSGANNTSLLPTPSHTYADTGIYKVKLTVSLAGLCAATDSFDVKVYPGFFPGFIYTGSCYLNPYSFTDTTRTNYGFVDTWSWNFGDLTTLADTSHNQNPQWTFPAPGPRNVTFIVTNSKGCVDTVNATIDVLGKPLITLPFNDTLICKTESVQLHATGTGVFSWTPLSNIINANSANPTVSPPVTTWYYVNLSDNGCANTDSVRVRVVDAVSLVAGNDTTICQGDQVQLHANSNGLTYSWTPAGILDNPNIINPFATVNSTTVFTITAFIGNCSATDQLTVITVPYPVANAGEPPVICYNTSTQLHASITGSSFNWTPTVYMNNPNVLNPVVSPPRTTSYILTVFDTLGCPKPGRDTILVTVNPKVIANAGHDTTVVINQPLHLLGTGGVTYFWSPGTGLNNVNIYNPTGVYGPGIDSVKYKLLVTDAIGCSDSDYVVVRIFRTEPAIFIPTAFTPNGDGLNDIEMPIPVGIDKLLYFRIYNRWGQEVFATSTIGQGWDGKINGRNQGSGVFVWVVNAVDYLGRSYFRKGTVTLIR
ncbi:MAG: gliding motility-associated C-terminal domain-containing protein [Chitinophagaceae bacterium]|nr:gliding motility-associated C-terminal domain-containing protein [Chitinophagaceae bacterium]